MASTPDPLPAKRKPRRLPGLLVVIVLAAVVAGVAWHARQFASQPAQHVIVISLDTTRADHFGCYDNTWIRTPRIDALAAESILFTDYMTVISTTLASHTSLFTGKYPHTHGVPRNGFIVHDDNVMLAEILKDAGFHTAGFLASFALDKGFNVTQGFDHLDQEFDIAMGEGAGDQYQRRAGAVTNAVIDYLDREGVPPNLFLFVHYFDPHQRYAPPPPFDTMYDGKQRAIMLASHPALVSLPQTEQDRLALSRYAGEVSYMDFQIGRLLDDLKRRGVLDDALVLVTSDHGELLDPDAEHKFDHGWTARQADMRAVGLIRLPRGEHGGTRLDLPVASIDMLPTVAAHLGLPIPDGVEGEVIDLKNPDRDLLSRTRFGEATWPWTVESDRCWHNNRKARCVREGPFKYIQTQYLGTEELYDLSSDPHERRNLLASLAPEAVARAAELRRRLEVWTDAANPLPSEFDQERREETIRRLQALGYLSEPDEEDD